MTLTGPDVKILQVHPTRLCNLRCVHCYSSSGPQERGKLGAPLLTQAVGDAAGLGYNVLSISGGEPFLYSGLEAVCREARQHKMLTTLVSNGTVITPRRLETIQGLVDMIAVSLDGRPERHNRMRGSSQAFHHMEEGLDALRGARIPFAFVFTLTSDSLVDLEWAADFALSQGAVMLQVHPVEEHGRACAEFSGQALADRQLGAAWMMVECLRESHRGKLVIHLDALNRYRLPDLPESAAGLTLGEIVSPLVIEDDGGVVPLRYGFPRHFAFGSLHTRTLADMAADWHYRRAQDFCDLYRDTLRRVRASNRMFANLYQLLAEEAAESNLVAIA